MKVDWDKNRVVTSSSDSSTKIWNTTNSEEIVDFFVPNVAALSFDLFKDLLVCGFSNGTIRYYELADNNEIGVTQVIPDNPCAVTTVRFLENGVNFFIGDLSGRIFLFRILTHQPLRTNMAHVVDVRSRIWSIDVSPFENFKTWLVNLQRNF
jgi:WD40 repeat protein